MKALKNTGSGYGKVECTSEQSSLIDEISAVLCMIIQIPETSMKGIVWNALRDWQIKSNNTIADIMTFSIAKRLNAVKEIFYHGNKILKRMLKHPKSKNEIILDVAFEKAFKHYLNYIYQNSQ
ncbi:MAG: hypothetical protein ACFFCY_04220 [Promethearchaeota archaeon]